MLSELRDEPWNTGLQYAYPRTAKRWDNADLAVWGRDVRYSTKVTLGNPPFEADLIFDTGSSVLWIADIPNDEYNNYSSHSSTTYKNVTDAAGKPTPLDLKYGIGWSRGWVGTETVTFGGQTVKDFKIGEVWNAFPLTSGAMYDWDRDVTMGGIKGFLGMSWQFYDNLPVLWQTLNKKWAAKEFGVYLQHNPLASGAFPGGVVTLGLVLPCSSFYANASGADPAYYTGDIHFNPIVGRPQIWDHWLVTIDGLTIGGKKVGKSAMAMIDTGTTQNFGPKEDIDAFYAQIPGSQVFITGKFGSGDHYQYYVPCDFNTPVQVRFGGVSYDMRPEDFIWWRPDGKCVGAFAATEV